MLMQWGLKEQLDPFREYEVVAWLIGEGSDHQCFLNEDRPFSKASLIDDADSFWGLRSAPELIEGVYRCL